MRILDRETDPRITYGPEGAIIPDGDWIVPQTAWVTPEIVAEARRVFDQRYREIDPRTLMAWLVKLATLCAGKMDLNEVRVRTEAYAEMLADMPGYLFTQDSLKHAAERFNWFPSYAELREMLDGVGRHEARYVDRLRALANWSDAT